MIEKIEKAMSKTRGKGFLSHFLYALLIILLGGYAISKAVLNMFSFQKSKHK
jgi:hypothetical protein